MAKAKAVKTSTKKETPKAISEKDSSINIKKFSSKKGRNILIIAIIILIAVLVYRFKSVFVAATVNGQPISRVAVLQELELEGGKQVLDTLITNSLILQEAQKEKVTASNQEIQDQITQISNNLKAQGEDLNTALAAQGMTQKDLTDRIKLQVLVQKMAGKGITVTDKEAQDYFNQNKASYPKNDKYADHAADIKTQLQQQKLSQAETDFVNNLKAKAKITHFVNY